MTQSLKQLFHTLLKTVWSLFLNGLFTLLPITLTLALFTFSFRLIVSWLEPISHYSHHMPSWMPHPEIAVAIILILLMGFILKSFILQSLVHGLENLVFKIPLVRPVYSGIKQLVHAFSPQDTATFKKVVLVEFPLKGVYSIGFLTSEVSATLIPGSHKKYFSIFIPTTPNPTSGFCVIVPEDAFTIIDLTHQEAMALIISGGIVQPERFGRKDSIL